MNQDTEKQQIILHRGKPSPFFIFMQMIWRKNRVAWTCFSALILFVPAVCLADDPTISPDTGDVYLKADESISLSVDPDPDPGTPPGDKECCDEGNPVNPEPKITKEWSGDVIDPDDPDKVRLDTESEGSKSVTVTFYVKWLCPGEDDPDPEDPGTYLTEATATYEVVEPQVTKVGFNDSHPLKKWPSADPIVNPIWVKPLGGSVTTDDPAAYTKNEAAKAELAIEASSPLSKSTAVQVRGNGVENFPPESATFHNWTWGSGELVLNSSSLYASVNFYSTLDVDWQYRVEKPTGGFTEWKDMNQTKHKLYTTYGTPIVTPTYDYALEKACGYATNQSSVSTVASSLNSGIDGDINYDPSLTVVPPIPLDIYAIGRAVCKGNAFLLEYLSQSVGVAASAKFIWGGANGSTVCFYKFLSSWGPSFQIFVAGYDYAPANPAYTYHAETEIGGTYYDPSYGGTGLITFGKTAPAGVDYYNTASTSGTKLGTSSPATSQQLGPIFPPSTVHYYDGTP